MNNKTLLDQEMFREYDIRGIADNNLTPNVVYEIGKAFATKMRSSGIQHVVTGRDGRLSSPAIEKSLSSGLQDGGSDVTSIGRVTTPILYYATEKLKTGTGIMVTGSHNPPNYNGLKMMMGGKTLSGNSIQEIYHIANDKTSRDGSGSESELSITSAYVNEIVDQIKLTKTLKVVVDCGNGVAGDFAPMLLRRIGANVEELYCDVDGSFPNHHPDPAEPINLQDLIKSVKKNKADIGLAFDGDGDRIGVVTNRGQIIWPDRLMMLFTKQILEGNPGATIISDVKCSMDLSTVVERFSGNYIMWKTGHSHIKAKMSETNAMLGGEFSGHICFRDKWYGYDDALYSAVRLLQILANSTQTADQIFEEFPERYCTPEIKVATTESDKFKIMADIIKNADFPEATINSIDGLRVEFENSWGLIRASNTSPVLVLRFEAKNQKDLSAMQILFQQKLNEVRPGLIFETTLGTEKKNGQQR